jgi:hypothetical protein
MHPCTWPPYGRHELGRETQAADLALGMIDAIRDHTDLLTREQHRAAIRNLDAFIDMTGLSGPLPPADLADALASDAMDAARAEVSRD